jgi:hypothetical protein
LFGYLRELGAQTIVVEDPYTDAGFLDDYTEYYARCFADYSRRCKRLHFFRRELTDADLRGLIRRPLSKNEAEALDREYLGFIVARPLPQTIIGRTVLRTFADDGGRRHFPATRLYTVNLYGLELNLRGLAFQEQDTVLAACATVALWSAFHKTDDLFGTGIPTPAAISRCATRAEHYGRPIPQHGLRVEEICAAVRERGLDPEAFDLAKTKGVPLISLLYGYLRMELPVLLIVEIPGRGCHAITLVGYSLQPTRQRAEEVPSSCRVIPMVGLRIDKLYGHDDQIGPYSQLIVIDPACCGAPPGALRSSWSDAKGQPFVYPAVVVVPVYPKIRLTFLDVQEWLTPVERIMSLIRPESRSGEWDVHLVRSNDYKEQLKHDSLVPDAVKESLLLAHHPRFWWRAALRVDGLEVCEFLFDATGIARSAPVGIVLWKVESFALAVGRALDDPTKTGAVAELLRSEPFLEFLRRSLLLRESPGAQLEASASGRRGEPQDSPEA